MDKLLLSIAFFVVLITAGMKALPLPLPEQYVHARYAQYVFKVEGPMGGSGTGFQVVAPSGRLYVLTNKHVCALSDPFGFVLIKGRRHRVVGVSRLHDLCVITSRVELPTGLRLAKEPAAIDQLLFTLGHPGGLPLQVHSGRLLGSLNNKYGLEFPNYVYSIYGAPGSSGSPVINANGEVEGIIAWLFTQTGQLGGPQLEQIRGFLIRY